jgi:hypothetical protein
MEKMEEWGFKNQRKAGLKSWNMLENGGLKSSQYLLSKHDGFTWI